MSKQQGQERVSRKPKPENRFYNFLSRSRSRSRTKEVVETQPSSRGGPDSVASPASKPPVRVASRPISSTTSATNATVVPGTPKARVRPLPAIPMPPPSEPIGSDPQIASRPPTPRTSGARKKLHNLFGINLSNGKKSSFGLTISQPSSSRSSLDVPPMPTQAASLGSSSKHKKASSRSHSPGTAAKARHKATISLTDISNVQCPAPASNMFHRIFSGSKAPTDNTPAISVSAPIRRPSQHRTTKSDSKNHITEHSLPEPELSTSIPKPHISTPPHIIYTPATPERPNTVSSPAKNRDIRKVSLDSGQRSRSIDAKGKGKDTQPHPDKGVLPTRSARYGVFDFENPPWNAGAMSIQRGDSGGTDAFSSMTSMTAWNRQHTERAGQERDSSFGPGLAGLGTIQREMSLRRGKEWEDQIRVREAERKRLIQQQRKQQEGQLPPPPPTPQDPLPVETDHTGGSTSTVGTGHSSSWGKAAGKRAAMSTKTASGSGVPKLATLTSHPAFDFEPPVPSSTSWSTSSLGMLHDISSSSSEKRSNGKGHSKPNLSSEERRPSPAPTATAIGHRSALKGRSLDLGLGLAWAPSTVREEALIPSFNVGRSFSQSSSGKTASDTGKSTPSNGHTKTGKAEDVSKLGKEVAAVFKSTLDRDGFASFKRYVHQFDAHEIPFDGPTGIITRVEQLLGETSTLKQHEKRDLMDQLVRIILRNA